MDTKSITIELPYVCGKEQQVTHSEITIIRLFNNYLTISMDAVVLVEDDLLGTKEHTKWSMDTVSKSAILSIGCGYDNHAERYDLTITASGTCWAYNCESRSTAVEVCEKLSGWWQSVEVEDWQSMRFQI